MDYRETERFMARAAELQPRVPEWCKAESMEMSVPQNELWHRKIITYSIRKSRFISIFSGRHRRREATK